MDRLKNCHRNIGSRLVGVLLCALTIVALVGIPVPDTAEAASHTLTINGPSPTKSTQHSYVFEMPFQSLAAAKADTGTVVLALGQYIKPFINSSGAKVFNFVLALTNTATNVDSTCATIQVGATASGPWITIYAQANQNTHLNIGTVPTKALSITTILWPYMRIYWQNADATTGGKTTGWLIIPK